MRNHDSNFVVSAAEAAEGIDDDRRALMGLAAGSLAGALFGLPPTAAQAAGGIGIVGAAQAQPAPSAGHGGRPNGARTIRSAPPIW
jgi:hypothetical protein